MGHQFSHLALPALAYYLNSNTERGLRMFVEILEEEDLYVALNIEGTEIFGIYHRAGLRVARTGYNSIEYDVLFIAIQRALRLEHSFLRDCKSYATLSFKTTFRFGPAPAEHVEVVVEDFKSELGNIMSIPVKPNHSALLHEFAKKHSPYVSAVYLNPQLTHTYEVAFASDDFEFRLRLQQTTRESGFYVRMWPVGEHIRDSFHHFDSPIVETIEEALSMARARYQPQP